MDLQYVLHLFGHGSNAFQSATDVVERWLRTKTVGAPPWRQLEGSASRPVTVNGPRGTTAEGALEVSVASREAPFGYKIELSQSQEAGRTNFVTSISLVEQEGGVSVRIALGLANMSETLIPAEHSTVKPPRIIQDLFAQNGIEWRVQGQLLANEYLKIQNLDQLDVLMEGLEGDLRLPMLLVDTVAPIRLQFAKEAKNQLLGMATVVCLPTSFLIREFNRKRPDSSIPFAGARLVWPDRAVRHNEFDESDLRNNEKALKQLSAILFKASTVSRSRNRIWDAADQIERAYKKDKSEIAFSLQLAIAQTLGDKDRQIGLLQSRIETLRFEHESAFENLVDENKKNYDSLLELQRENRRLESKVAALDARFASPRVQTRGFDGLQESPDKFEELFESLELATAGSLIFTANSVEEWKQSNFPRASKVRDALIELAKASMEWRAKEGQIGENLSNWLEERIGLKVPMQDGGLVSAGKDEFEYMGMTYSRIPHIKVSDQTDPKSVARVYFAVDQANFRFLVDHVGHKLY